MIPQLEEKSATVHVVENEDKGEVIKKIGMFL